MLCGLAMWAHQISLDVLLALALALITLLIPIVIFLLDKTQLPWDNNVIWVHVLKIKKIGLSLFLLFSPLMFWEYWDWLIIPECNAWKGGRMILLIPFFLGLGLIIDGLTLACKWLSERNSKILEGEGFRNQCRKEFLKNQTNLAEKLDIWKKLFSKSKFSNIKESLFEFYAENVKALIDKKNDNLASKYVYAFDENTDIFPSFRIKVFKIFLGLCLLSYNKMGPISLTTQALFDFIMNNYTALITSDRIGLRELFFHLAKHTREKQREYREYIDILFGYSETDGRSELCLKFFKITESMPAEDIGRLWASAFPNEWKIKSKGLENDENYVKKIWLSTFLIWAKEQLKIMPISHCLNFAINNLFPTAEPKSMTAVLFLFFCLEDKNFYPSAHGTMSGIIENIDFGSFNFGVYNHLGHASGFESEYKNRTAETYKLSIKIFSQFFTTERLEKCRETLRGLRFNNDRELNNRGYYVEVIKGLITTLDSSKNLE